MNSSMPIRELDALEFRALLFGREIHVSAHAYDHLHRAQRKVFKEQELVHMLTQERPRRIYLQTNGRYAVYYRRTDGYRKLVVAMEKDAVIVSFVDTQELPLIDLP